MSYKPLVANDRDAKAERKWRQRGAMMRAARMERGLTQQELADKVGVARVTIARVEAALARPSIDLLENVAKALGVKLTELLD